MYLPRVEGTILHETMLNIQISLSYKVQNTAVYQITMNHIHCLLFLQACIMYIHVPSQEKAKQKIQLEFKSNATVQFIDLVSRRMSPAQGKPRFKIMVRLIKTLKHW